MAPHAPRRGSAELICVPVLRSVARVPDMSFPVSSLLRAYAFQGDWAAVDRLLALAAKRQLREFQDGLPFIRAKRAELRIGAMTRQREVEREQLIARRDVEDPIRFVRFATPERGSASGVHARGCTKCPGIIVA